MVEKIQSGKIDFTVSLSPNEVWQRITAAADERKIAFFAPSGFEGNRRFLYTVNGSEIKIQLRQRRKGLPPILTFKIEPINDGSRIHGNISVDSSWIFLLIMLGVFFVIGVVLSYSAVGKLLAGQPLADFTPFDFFAPLFIINSLVLPFIFLLKVKRDKAELIEWLENLFADQLNEP